MCLNIKLIEDLGVFKPYLFRLMALYLRTVEFFRAKVEFGDNCATVFFFFTEELKPRDDK